MDYDGLHLLMQFIDFKREQDIDFELAINLLQQNDKILTYTISDMAKLCFVSDSTLSRFVNKLGFKSYHEFRQSFKAHYFFENDYPAFFEDDTAFDYSTSVNNLGIAIARDIQNTLKLFNDDLLIDVVRQIHNASSTTFYGLNIHQHIAIDFQTRLLKLGKPSFAFNSIEQQYLHAKTSGSNDLAIFISVHGRSVLLRKDILEVLKSNGTHIIVMSQDVLAITKIYVDQIIKLSGSKDIDTGRFVLMAVLEAILLKYYELYYEEIEVRRKLIKNRSF